MYNSLDCAGNEGTEILGREYAFNWTGHVLLNASFIWPPNTIQISRGLLLFLQQLQSLAWTAA